jgi:hypothetical protein
MQRKPFSGKALNVAPRVDLSSYLNTRMLGLLIVLRFCGLCVRIHVRSFKKNPDPTSMQTRAAKVNVPVTRRVTTLGNGQVFYSDPITAGNVTWTTSLGQRHSGNVTRTTSLWQHHSGNITLATSLWQHHSGNITLATSLWQHHSGNITLATSLWQHHSGNITRATSLGQHHSGNVTRATSLGQHHSESDDYIEGQWLFVAILPSPAG